LDPVFPGCKKAPPTGVTPVYDPAAIENIIKYFFNFLSLFHPSMTNSLIDDDIP
jgi:hypothetical protein